jgi:hypothetical protein
MRSSASARMPCRSDQSARRYARYCRQSLEDRQEQTCLCDADAALVVKEHHEKSQEANLRSGEQSTGAHQPP